LRPRDNDLCILAPRHIAQARAQMSREGPPPLQSPIIGT
jgi:hypothetical protein